jgi:hypothetical protein
MSATLNRRGLLAALMAGITAPFAKCLQLPERRCPRQPRLQAPAVETYSYDQSAGMLGALAAGSVQTYEVPSITVG